jgi:DNA-binding response OmpR family regulator
MNTSPTRILFVDDHQDSCDLVRLMLNQSDNTHAVTTISTAEEALSLMAQQTFDLYILDYWLPKMSGLELCKKIRQTDKQTPILFFTAMARPVDYAEGIKAGANEYLVKPNDLESLPKTVSRLLNRSKLYAKQKFLPRRRCSNII